MEEASLQLTFAFIGIIIGVIIGAFSYRVLSKSQRHVSNMQLRLLESERQVAELKADMNSHLSDTHRQVSDVRTTLDRLDRNLRQQAGHWGDHDRLADHETSQQLQTAAHEPLADDSTPDNDPPRDYADGQSGTLSEDFGLKDTADEQASQPPRY